MHSAESSDCANDRVSRRERLSNIRLRVPSASPARSASPASTAPPIARGNLKPAPPVRGGRVTPSSSCSALAPPPPQPRRARSASPAQSARTRPRASRPAIPSRSIVNGHTTSLRRHTAMGTLRMMGVDQKYIERSVQIHERYFGNEFTLDAMAEIIYQLKVQDNLKQRSRERQLIFTQSEITDLLLAMNFSQIDVSRVFEEEKSPETSRYTLEQMTHLIMNLRNKDRAQWTTALFQIPKEKAVSSAGFETPSESESTPFHLDVPKPSLRLSQQHISETISEEDTKLDAEDVEDVENEYDSDYDSDEIYLSGKLGIVPNHFGSGDIYLDQQSIAAIERQFQTDHDEYVVPLHALNQLLSGEVYPEELTKDHHRRIKVLLHCHAVRDSALALSTRSLFEKRTTVFLNLREVTQHFTSTQSLLCPQRAKDKVFVNFKALLTVFPHCQNLCVMGGGSDWGDDGQNVPSRFQLGPDVFDAMLKMLARRECPLMRIQIQGTEKSLQTNPSAMEVYAKKYMKIGWTLTRPRRTTLLMEKQVL